MIRRLMLIGLSTVSVLLIALAARPTTTVFASTPQQEVCQGVGAASGRGNCQSDISLTRVIKNVINIFSVIVGIVAVIMIILSGFKYITAAGDSGNITSAKQTLTFAIIGIVVTALSQFIVWFVLDNIK